MHGLRVERDEPVEVNDDLGARLVAQGWHHHEGLTLNPTLTIDEPGSAGEEE